MMKSVFPVMMCACLCLCVTAHGQQDFRQCGDGACDLNRGFGVADQPHLSGQNVGETRPRAGVRDTRCEDGECDIHSRRRHSDCQDGHCEPGSSVQDRRSGSFPYVSERRATTKRSRRLDDPFRPAGQHRQWNREFDRRDSRQLPGRFEPVSFETRRPIVRSISWMSDIQRAAELAGQESRPILLQVSASWCPHCQRMQRETYTDPDLMNLISEQFVAIAVDADQQRDFVEQMNIQSLPTTLIVAPDLRVLNRLQGFQSADQLLRVLSR